MPFLDPSTILLDPMLCDSFVVQQRAEMISAAGLSTVTTVVVPRALGVVVPATPDDLERLDDQDRGRRTIKIYTRQHLNQAATGRKPDFIVWAGDTFVVCAVDPYTRSGAGWTEVLATSIDSVEALT